MQPKGLVAALPRRACGSELAALQQGLHAAHWRTPIAFLFIDGGHTREAAFADYDGWTPHLMAGATLAIHDVFPDPADGGRPPYEVYCAAMASRRFEEIGVVKSLRLLRRI